jgi:sulfatase maturation enzyme AslB (radical SAM superfamily)
MFVRDSTERISTFQRPQAEKITASLPDPHHILEDILRNSYVRRLLKLAATPGRDGKCFFERLCENYDNPGRDGAALWRWAMATKVINLAIQRAGWDKELIKRKLFHHPPTVKALALTARSIAQYGLTSPQRFSAPLFVVWNFTQACNLSCKHCYQNATRKPAPDELTLEEKLGVVDRMADAYVPFLALAGGEPLVSKDLWPVLEHATRRGIHLTLATALPQKPRLPQK